MAIAPNIAHAKIDAFPEYFEAIAVPKKSPVPIIEPIERDNIVQKPKTLFSSAIIISFFVVLPMLILKFNQFLLRKPLKTI